MEKRDWNVFISSVFFVLGFSVVFSIVGVLAVLDESSWLGNLFGVYMPVATGI